MITRATSLLIIAAACIGASTGARGPAAAGQNDRHSSACPSHRAKAPASAANAARAWSSAAPVEGSILDAGRTAAFAP